MRGEEGAGFVDIAAGDAEVGLWCTCIFLIFIVFRGNPGRTGLEYGIKDSAPPFHEASIVEDMFSGVLDAAGEEVLVLGAGEEGED